MPGYTRILHNTNFIWVRFEHIGRSGKFDLLLDAFRAAFPLAEWDEINRGWRLSASQANSVQQFCLRVLGPNSVRLQEYNASKAFLQQLTLF